MPCRDGTGPAGMGPGTGWAEGPCAGTPAGDPVHFVGGFGRRGCGLGMRGRGPRNMFRATGLPRWARGETGDGVEALRRQAKSLENALAEIHGQIEQLEAGLGKDAT